MIQSSTIFPTSLQDAAGRRWGEKSAEALAGTLNGLEAALRVIGEQPSVEPGPWPPAPLPGATVPRLERDDAGDEADWTDAGVTALAAAIVAGAVSPVEVVEALLARADHVEQQI